MSTQTILLATRNKHKVEEIQHIWTNLPLRLLSLEDFPEIPEIEETGATLEENALLKAKTVFHHTRLLTIADDSGLEVDFLEGAPGVYSARYAGPAHDYAANNRKLLDALKDADDSQRRARFRCAAAIVGEDIEATVEGVVHGRIIRELRGQRGFGYDPLFVPDGYKQTFAELGESIKNQISHRSRAFRKAERVLHDYLTEKASQDKSQE